MNLGFFAATNSCRYLVVVDSFLHFSVCVLSYFFNYYNDITEILLKVTLNTINHQPLYDT